MSGESPIFSQTYDLLRWLLPLLGQMPREHRSGLARQLATCAFGLQEHLIAASKMPAEAKQRLRHADANLAELRVLLRLAQDLHAISFKQYEEGARRSTEIGRLLGGWLRTVE
jgi:four helix bundle protein